MSVRKSSGLNRVEKRDDTNTYQDEVFGTVPPVHVEVPGGFGKTVTSHHCRSL